MWRWVSLRSTHPTKTRFRDLAAHSARGLHAQRQRLRPSPALAGDRREAEAYRFNHAPSLEYWIVRLARTLMLAKLDNQLAVPPCCAQGLPQLNARMHASTLSLATSMPTTTTSFCAIIHSLPARSGLEALELFGLRKTELSSYRLVAFGRNGLVPATGGWCATARSPSTDFWTQGRREDRVLAAPAVSRAICANKSAHEHTGQREHSGLPCAMALRLTSCSSRRTALLPPSPRGTLPANLTPAPRRPNHTTSPYASGAYVYRAIRVHRISPRVRDDGQRPSSAVRRAKLCR